MKDHDIALRSSEITIPNVRLGLEDLLVVIHSLDELSRARVAHALAETEMAARLKGLITQLAARAPVERHGYRHRSRSAGGAQRRPAGMKRSSSSSSRRASNAATAFPLRVTISP